MNPGGATERALHAQIGRQQKRLIEQVATDAAEAAAKLSAGGWSGNAGAIGGPESVAARTLGARMTGAKVEAEQRQAYAEALDRMKRAGAQAGKGAQADATGGVTAVAGDVAAKAPGEIRIDEVPGGATAPSSEPEKPTAATPGAERTRPDGSAAMDRPGGGHPLINKQPAHVARREEARERAETDKHAGLGNIEHEAERVERRRRRRAAEEAYRKGRQSGLDAAGNLLRSIDIAIEHGALPRRFLPLFRHVAGAGRRLQADRYIAVLDRLAQLHDDRRTVFDTLPPRLRTAVSVHRHLAARDGRLDPADRSDDNKADLRRRSSLVRSIANELDRSEALRTLGFVADWTPVIGEFKSGIEALIALHNYAEARERGDLKAATQYGEEAAWAFVGAAPGLGYSRKGRKLLRQLAAPVGKLSVEAANALARKIEDAAAKRQPKRKVEDEPEELPKNFDRGPEREFSERLAARSKLSILRLYAKISKREKLGLDDVFSEGMLGLDKEQRKIASIVVAGAKGKAAESRVKGLMQDSGFVTATKESGRAVTTKDKGQRRYDIATTDKFSSFLGLFVFPGAYKATVRNNRTVQIEVKSGGGKKKPRQHEIDEDVKKAARRGKPEEVANREAGLVIVDVVDLQMPTHWIDKEALAGKLRGPLTGKFGRLRTDAFLRDLDEFYRRSTDKTPIPFGVVLLYLAGRLPRLDDDEPDRSQ